MAARISYLSTWEAELGEVIEIQSHLVLDSEIDVPGKLITKQNISKP